METASKLVLKAQALADKPGYVRLFTGSERVPPKDVLVSFYSELLAEALLYRREVEKSHKVQFDVYRPNLYAAHVQSRKIWTEAYSPKISPAIVDAMKKVVEAEEEKEFEVNMMEPLVGWKAWEIKPLSGRIFSQYRSGFEWVPDEALEAVCNESCGIAPGMKHSCGIYAADGIGGTTHYGSVVGEVYGWGRYIRGESGWRSQYAYPKAFHLQPGQEGLIDKLRAYHVPIFVMQPLRVYDPREEGYENWGYQENGDFGASGESGSEED